MNNPIFFQFKHPANSLDKLIKDFDNRYKPIKDFDDLHSNSYFPEAPKDYFHEYIWPDIVLSDKTGILHQWNDEDKKEHDFSIELLGCYRPDREEVVLFIPKIKETAKAFFESSFSDENYNEIEEKKFTELLSELVLVHEFVHWLMHRIGFNPVQYAKKDEVSFHEGFAQLFTNYYCSKDANMYSLFVWLESQQPPQYLAYKDIIESDDKDMVSSTDITNAFILLDILRYCNLQSWECTKLLKEYQTQLKLKNFKGLIIALENSKSCELFKSFLNALVVPKIDEKVKIDTNDFLLKYSKDILHIWRGQIAMAKYNL